MTSQGFSETRLSRMAAVMRGYVERGDTAGVVALVNRHDDIHVECAGVQDIDSKVPMTRDTIFRVASMTKPVTAVAAMMLVEETVLKLDAPIDKWLPELADCKVLRSIDSPIDDTVAADRPITLRDLLTFTFGFGAVMAPPGLYPIQAAIEQAGLAPGPKPPKVSPDAWVARLAALPLLHQPGEHWMYHTGSDVLGVLIARASGISLGSFLKERIFEPLGMNDTGFSVPDSEIVRLSTAYTRDDSTHKLTVFDPASDGEWSRPPAFEAGGGGLVSTADDYLKFGRMMLGQGKLGNTRLLARPTVDLMMTDHISAEQKDASPFFPGFWDAAGWGFGASIVTRQDSIGPSVGSYEWTGGLGTAWCVDPVEDTVCVFLNQKLMSSPDDIALHQDLFTTAYSAIGD